MKRIIVTLTEEYLLPDDWEPLTHPDDQIPCLHGDGRHFMPCLEWYERGAVDLPGELPPKQLISWTTVDEDRDDWFIEQMLTTATEIRDHE